MAMMRSCSLMVVLLLMTIIYNIESAGAGRILRHKHSAKVIHAKEEHPQIKSRADESGLEQNLPRSKDTSAIGHMQLMRSHKKINTLKNKLPSGPSPGVGHAYINNGGVKSSWRSESILKTKLPSGSSPGIGH